MVFTNAYNIHESNNLGIGSTEVNNIIDIRSTPRLTSLHGSAQNSVAGGNTPRNIPENDNSIPNQTMEVREINELTSSIVDIIAIPNLLQNLETGNNNNDDNGELM